MQFFQLYVNQNRAITKGLIQRAEAAGCKALFVTVAAPTLAKREKDMRMKFLNRAPDVQQEHSIDLWHERLGHIGASEIDKLIRNDMVIGASELKSAPNGGKLVCEACLINKSKRLRFYPSTRKTLQLLELVHSDVVGAVTPQTMAHKQYVVTFIDDSSRFTIIYLIAHKSEVLRCFQDYLLKVERHCGTKLKILRSDGGGEYIGPLTDFCNSRGIKQDLTNTDTPQSNGKAERKNGPLFATTRSLLYRDESELTRRI